MKISDAKWPEICTENVKYLYENSIKGVRVIVVHVHYFV